MKSIVLLFFGTGFLCFGIQAQTSEVCTISAFVTPARAKEKDLETMKSIELGRVDIAKVTEGTTIPWTFRVPGTRLYTYVEIFFDDDMKFYDSLYPALTVSIVFNTAARRTTKNVVGLTTTQSACDEKQVDVMGYAKAPRKRVGVLVSCRGKKPKDE